jgi:hypothetical protein
MQGHDLQGDAAARRAQQLHFAPGQGQGQSKDSTPDNDLVEEIVFALPGSNQEKHEEAMNMAQKKEADPAEGISVRMELHWIRRIVWVQLLLMIMQATFTILGMWRHGW